MSQRSDERWKAAYLRNACLTLAIAIVTAMWWLLTARQPSACRGFQVVASFAGEPNRLRAWLDSQSPACVLSESRVYWALAFSGLAACAFGTLVSWALHRWWPRDGEANHWLVEQKWFVFVPLGVGVLGVAQRVAVAFGVAWGDPPMKALAPNALWLAAALAWPTAIGVGVTLVVAAVMGQRRLRPRLWRELAGRPSLVIEDRIRVEEVCPEPGAPFGLGICLSGGGIRAGAVALGALSVLETRDADGQPARGRSLLERARYVATVSGGGYTTSAWFNATRSPGAGDRGAGEGQPGALPRLIGDVGTGALFGPPRNYDDLGEPQTLFHHVATRQKYLKTGVGGMIRSVMTALGFLLLHLAVLGLVIGVVAWPAGRLTRTWYVFGGPGCPGSAQAADMYADLPENVCSVGPGEQEEGLTGETQSAGVPCVSSRDDLDSTIRRTQCFLRRTGIQHRLHAAHLAPIVLFGGLGLAVWAPTLFMRRTCARRVWRLIGSAAFATAATAALVLIAGPLLLDGVYPLIREAPQWVVGSGVAGVAGLAMAGYRLVVRTSKRFLLLLSGYVALAALLAWGIYVAGTAAAHEGLLALDWLSLAFSPLPSDITLYVFLAIISAVILSQLEPRKWSLHVLYRNRLRDAFASTTDVHLSTARNRRKAAAAKAAATAAGTADSTTIRSRDPNGAGTARVWPLHRRHEPPLDDFATKNSIDGNSVSLDDGCVNGPPIHLICCTVARRNRNGTGIKGESFVVSPYRVTLYQQANSRVAAKPAVPPEVSQRSRNLVVYGVPTSRYLRALPKKMRTESMWAAVSGAAVAPAMGRHTQGTLGTLFGVLNVRLGVWMPNPRWLADEPLAAGEPKWGHLYQRAGVINLAKEIVGAWSLDDRHLYVTDGGHWDNLGLVELLRRRCKTIICVDASGDAPGSFNTLREAADLASLQVGATIHDVPPPLPPSSPVPSEGCMMLNVTYQEMDRARPSDWRKRDHPDARIVYLPARLWTAADLELRAFAAEDPVFPWYSTGDQLLSNRQFQYLVRLGRCLAEQALDSNEVQGALREALHVVPAAPAGPVPHAVVEGDLVVATPASINDPGPADATEGTRHM